MILSPIPENELERLNELMRYDVLHTQYEEDFDEIVQLASKICHTPISTITLIDAHMQWFKAKVGIDNREGNRDTSFCGHAIMDDEMMVVNDAMNDKRFHDNPLVLNDPNIRFYAGFPLISENGFKLGTLCVIDRIPRQLTDEQLLALRVLGKQVIKLFELRLRFKEAELGKKLIEEQNTRLEEHKTIQNKIISIISHDVRGPVTSLKSMIELINSKNLSEEEATELLALLDKQLDGTLDMLTNLVEWGGLLLRKQVLESSTVDLKELVSSHLFTSLKPFAETKQNKLVSEIPDNCLVKADANALRFIIRNLISNANKFTSDGTITVRATKQVNGQTKLEVSDTGCGIPTEVKQVLFNSSKRMSREGTNREKGTGLGLILAHEFASAMGTILSVESETGMGTTFSMLLQAM